MTTELDKLKQAFDNQDVPAPSSEVKKHAIAAAMREFEQEKSTSTKGSTHRARLNMTPAGVFNYLFRRRAMKTKEKNLKPFLIGGASFAVLTLALLSTLQLQRDLETEKLISEAIGLSTNGSREDAKRI